MTFDALQYVNRLGSAAPGLPGLTASGVPSELNGPDFVRTLSRMAEVETQQDAARDAAEKLVATSLIMPLLEEVRTQPLDANLFGSGIAKDAFRQRLDQQFADRIVRSTNFPLVDRIYQTVTGAVAKRGGEVNIHG